MEPLESLCLNPCILVVDDMPESLRLLSRILTRSGYRVQPVSSGTAAIQAVQEERPDLILLDIEMPVMNGFELCTRWKSDEKTKDIPVIFISGLEATEEKVRAFRIGGVDYITKPFRVEEVVARVGTHLQLRQATEVIKCERERLQTAHERLSKAMRELRSGIEVAGEIQRSMLPAPGMHALGDAISLVARYTPAISVGGDFFDFAAIDDGHVGFILADVCGHGLHAAFITALIKMSFVLAGDRRLDPVQFTLGLNDALCKFTPEGSFATVVYCTYELASRRLRYVNAGHSPFPIVVTPGERSKPLSAETNPLLGIIELSALTEEVIPLPPGATLLLATDGLTEARNPVGMDFGYDRLLATVDRHAGATPAELDQAVFDELTRFRDGTAQGDDIAMLTIRFG
jgi:phosphoserine phosphatase RsbU/P